MTVLAPLGALFRHAKGLEPDADEILICTFNHDLGFFEKAVLGIAQLTGARITIVADAGMSHHDVYAVRRAGTAYLPGLARCSHSFHPKVVVIASGDRATVGIGSGNLSMAGWQGNDELWSWHHATPDTGSTVVPETGAWLRALADAVSVAPPVGDALRRVGDLLGTFPATDPDARVVASINAPIIDQLPSGPVDELNVYAPFYDQNGSAVAALIERFQPAVVRVGFQPTMTSINGAAIAALVGAGGEIRELPQNRYRHGKLIEWSVDGQRWALTGSANLSAAALLRTVSTGGNVEIGVVAPVDDTLMPEGAVTTESHLASIEYRGMAPSSGPPTVIQAATRAPEGIEVTFLRPLGSGGRVEFSELNWLPDVWVPVAEVTAGAAGSLIPDGPGGSRLRVRFSDGTFSAVAWVTDLTSVMRNRAAVRSGPKPPEIGDVLTDVTAAERFFQLLVDRQKSGTAPVAFSSQTGTGGTPASAANIESWEDYLDRCAGRDSAYTIAFALGLPLPTRQGGSTVQMRVVDWETEVVSDDAEGLEGDTAETVDFDEDQGLPTPQLSKAQDQVRKRYRTFARKMIHDWVAPEPLERVIALRSALLLVASGAWARTDEEWQPLILDGVERLLIDNPPKEYLEAAGSIGLLALSVVQSTLSHTEEGILELRFERTLKKTADLVGNATDVRLAQYADGLTRRFSASARPEIAMGIVERLTSSDELGNVVTDLAERGYTAVANGNVLDLTKQVPQPLLPALTALAEAEDISPLLIRCGSADGAFVNILWRTPDVVVVSCAKPGKYFARHYSYATGGKPGADIRRSNQLNGDREIARSIAGTTLLPIVNDLMEELGVDELGAP